MMICYRLRYLAAVHKVNTITFTSGFYTLMDAYTNSTLICMILKWSILHNNKCFHFWYRNYILMPKLLYLYSIVLFLMQDLFTVVLLILLK